MRRPRDGFRGRRIGQSIDLPRLADVPVLTELASKIAPGRSERQDRRSRQEVIQRLLLDRIDAKSAGSPVGRQDDLTAFAGAHETEAPLALLQFAKARTQIALDTPVVEAMPVFGRDDCLIACVHRETIITLKKRHAHVIVVFCSPPESVSERQT